MRKPSLVAIWIVIAITMGFLGISLAGLKHTKYYRDSERTMHWEAIPQNRAETQSISISVPATPEAELTHICIVGSDANKFSLVSPEPDPQQGRCAIVESPIELSTTPFPIILKYDSSEIGTHEACLQLYVKYDEEVIPTAVEIKLCGTTVSPLAGQASIEWVSPHPPTGSPAIPEKLVSGTTYRLRWNASRDLVGFNVFTRSQPGKPGSWSWTKLNSERLTTTYFDWYVYEKDQKFENCQFAVLGYNTPTGKIPVIVEYVEWDLGFVRIISPSTGSSFDGKPHCNGTPDRKDWYNPAVYLTGYSPATIYGYAWQVSHDGTTWKPTSPSITEGNPGWFEWYDPDMLYEDDPTSWIRMGIYKAGPADPVLIDLDKSRTFTIKEGNRCSNPVQSKAVQPINQ